MPDTIIIERPQVVDLPRVNLRNLACLCYANGMTVWGYRAEALFEATRPGFFADAACVLSEGDHIHVSAPDGGAVLYVTAGGVVPMCLAVAP